MNTENAETDKFQEEAIAQCIRRNICSTEQW